MKTWRRWSLLRLPELGVWAGEVSPAVSGPLIDQDHIVEVVEIEALDEAEESARFYRNEWENACERARYTKEVEAELAKAKAKIEKFKKKIKKRKNE